jgi:hypothetical protein
MKKSCKSCTFSSKPHGLALPHIPLISPIYEAGIIFLGQDYFAGFFIKLRLRFFGGILLPDSF